MQTMAMRKNQTALDGKTCLWSNVEGHPLFSIGIEFIYTPIDFSMGNIRSDEIAASQPGSGGLLPALSTRVMLLTGRG